MGKVDFVQLFVAVKFRADTDVTAIIDKAEEAWSALLNRGYGNPPLPSDRQEPGGGPKQNAPVSREVGLANPAYRPYRKPDPGKPAKDRNTLLAEKAQWERMIQQKPDYAPAKWLLNEVCRDLGLPDAYPAESGNENGAAS